MKQIQIKKKIIDSKVEDRINYLKEQLKQVNLEYYSKVYNILREIYVLRKSQIRGYKVVHLAKEKGIELTSGQIYYYFRASRFSKKTKELIKKGELNVGTALFVIRKNKKFQEDEKLQDKAMESIISKRLTTSDFSHIPSESIISRLDDKKIVPKQNRLGVNLIYKLNEVRDSIRTNKYSIRKDILEKIKRECFKIIEEIKNK